MSKPDSHHKRHNRSHACWMCKGEKYRGIPKHLDKREQLKGGSA